MKWIKRILLSIILITVSLIVIVVLYFGIKYLINPWSETIRLPKLHRPEVIYFVESHGVIIGYGEGENLTRDQLYKSIGTSLHDKAFVYYTKDNGKSWILVFEKNDSVLRKVSYNKASKTLYALGHENFGTKEDTSFIIQSNNSGRDWTKVISHNKKFLGLDYSCKQTHYIWTAYQVEIDDLDKAKVFVDLPSNCAMYSNNPVTDNFCNLWIECDNELMKVTKDGRQDIIISQDKVWIDTLNFNNSDNSLWFILRDDKENKTILYQKKSDGELIEKKIFPDYLPGNLLISGEKIIIPFTDTNKGSFLGLEKVLYHSSDYGNSWSTDFFYPVFSREPFFLNNNELYINAALQRIEKRKF